MDRTTTTQNMLLCSLMWQCFVVSIVGPHVTEPLPATGKNPTQKLVLTNNSIYCKFVTLLFFFVTPSTPSSWPNRVKHKTLNANHKTKQRFLTSRFTTIKKHLRQKKITCCPATQTDSNTRSGHDIYIPALWFSNPITKASCSLQSIGKLPSLRQIWSSEETTPAPSWQKHIQQPNCGDYRNRGSRICPHFLLRWGLKV